MTIQPVRPELSLLDGRFYADDPHASFLWMRENEPVYWDAQASVWGITRHDDLQAVSKDSETFCNRFGMRPDAPAVPSMINFDGDVHKRRRNLVNRGFTPRRVAEHETRIRSICAGLIESARQKGRVDFVSEVAAPLPMIVIGDMLGVLPEDRDRLLRWSDDLISGLSLSAPPEKIAATAHAAMEYAAYTTGVIADRRSRAPGDDLMSILVHGEIDGDRLDDEALVQESLLILVGGDETTRHVITGGMYQLLVHPDQRRKLAANPAAIPVAVEEMLRWVTPIQNMSRTVTRDVELRGRRLREGDKVMLLYPSGNRDALVFDDPFRFDIERDPNPHLAFGGYGGALLPRLGTRATRAARDVRGDPVARPRHRARRRRTAAVPQFELHHRHRIAAGRCSLRRDRSDLRVVAERSLNVKRIGPPTSGPSGFAISLGRVSATIGATGTR
jgi:cytochrome P450 family 142 subfamily A polypeptide 1